MPIIPPHPKPLSSSTKFSFGNENAGFEVGAFWSWAFSDLKHNDVRGILAEFIVARALGLTLPLRESWASHDLTTPDGIRIEVKSSGYMQSWVQKGLSPPKFTGLRARSSETTEMGDWKLGEEKATNADVYVFCLHTAQSHEVYDPLDIGQWQFFVASANDIQQDSITLNVVQERWPEVGFGGLNDAVRRAAAR